MARALLKIAVAALAARTAYLDAGYFFNLGTRRFHLETGALWFALAVALLVATRPSRPEEEPPAAAKPAERWLLRARRARPVPLVWIVAAVVLYWQAIGLGLLSDDFVIAERATRLTTGVLNPDAFRPLPLALWGALLSLHSGPAAIHLINILLHGTNALLTTRLLQQIVGTDRAVLAGALVLTAPMLVEAVAWCSGVFDVMATTFVLLTVLAARDYDRESSASRLRLYACSLAGVLCKETAMVAPLLILIDAWMRRARPRRSLTIDLIVLFGVMGSLGVVRLALASELVRRPLTKYAVQRWLFGTAGGLAAPWHAEIVRLHPWVPAVFACVLIALLAALAWRTVDDRSNRAALAMSAWVLVATAPAMTFFFVAPDLQGSRYLYLATVGWAGLIVAATGSAGSQRVRFALALPIVVLIAFGIYGIHRHLQPWIEAAAMRDAFIRAARDDERLRGCATVSVEGAPDSVRGAYVLRNGADELLRATLAGSARGRAVFDTCAVRWDAATGRFEQRKARTP